ncbi:3-phosphoshikimate 1-carboxyvinyltransferase [bacterium E08(2017)]|nr:3-phosphoshikimate 1-carboxyvinyltransferase [bacterium E08(2017)]
MSDWEITPASYLKGAIEVPGDKSISHRLAMLCGLAEGQSTITGFLMSEDCLNTLEAVKQLGAEVVGSLQPTADSKSGEIRITGVGGQFKKPDGMLDMGNSGTGMRLMSGLLAWQPFDSGMTGDESLCSRPMDRVKAPLEHMGAEITLQDDGCAPMTIHGKALNGIEYELPVASAQVKSCVLLAGLGAKGDTIVIEPRETRDHTERLLLAMGADLRSQRSEARGQEGYGRITLKGGSKLQGGGDWNVPGDISSASFWIAAAACMDGAELKVTNVGLNPRRTAILDVLKRMGADIEWTTGNGQRTTDHGVWEEVGDVTVRGASLTGTVIEGDEIPNLIDELPIAAVVGALAEGETIIKDAKELRVKESDRISTVVAGLKAFGVEVEEKQDGMIVKGGSPITGGCEIDSCGDHRIAMSMAVLGLFSDAPVSIQNVDCVDTSYPGFYSHMKELTADE